LDKLVSLFRTLNAAFRSPDDRVGKAEEQPPEPIKMRDMYVFQEDKGQP
jgi:hypothetical protein